MMGHREVETINVVQERKLCTQQQLKHTLKSIIHYNTHHPPLLALTHTHPPTLTHPHSPTHHSPTHTHPHSPTPTKHPPTLIHTHPPILFKLKRGGSSEYSTSRSFEIQVLFKVYCWPFGLATGLMTKVPHP